MARVARRVLAGGLHVVAHGARKGAHAFPDAQAAERFEAALVDAAAHAGVRLHAMGLWPGEVRLLCTPAQAQGLADMLQAAGRIYVPWLNRRTAASGSPWAGRFQSAVVDAQGCFFDVLRFVEGLAADAAEGVAWRSSLSFHLGRARADWLTEHPRYWALGNTPFEREAAHARWLEQPLAPTEVRRIRLALSRGGALGDVAFLQSLERQTGLPWLTAPRGRPRKSNAAIAPA